MIIEGFSARSRLACPSPHLMRRLRFHIESMLLSDRLPPCPDCITMFLERISNLFALAHTGKPLLYKKQTSLSLMFNIFSLQSEMNLAAPDDLVLAYTQSMMGFLLFKLHPKKIGMIGLGGGSLAKFCHRHLPESVIQIAEIDQQIIDLRDQFFIPPDDERFQVECIDGAEFVRRARAEFDVLLVDGFDETGQPPQLCSSRFYQDCHQALSADGLMVVNLLGDDLQQTDIYINRMQSCFEGSVISIYAPDSLNRIAFAFKGKAMQPTPELVQKRMLQLNISHPAKLRATAQRILAELQSKP